MSGLPPFRHSLPVRHGLLTLGLLALVLTSALLSRPALPAALAVAVPSPTSSEIAPPAGHEWPRAVLRLWILAPLLLTHDR